VINILESVKGEKHLTERLLLVPYNQSENIWSKLKSNDFDAKKSKTNKF